MNYLYDLNYYENLLKMYSKSAEQINNIRWEFISDINPKVVLDYGSGVGWFRAYRPKDVEVYSYDIGNFPQTGIELRMYDVVCFWDVVEHVPDFTILESILNLSRHVAITLPIYEENVENLEAWKHFKPNEHLHYFTKKSLVALLNKYFFEEIKSGQPECPPRQDIWSFLFKRSK